MVYQDQRTGVSNLSFHEKLNVFCDREVKKANYIYNKYISFISSSLLCAVTKSYLIQNKQKIKLHRVHQKRDIHIINLATFICKTICRVSRGGRLETER